MKSTRTLFVIAVAASSVWLICIGLYLQLTSYDPYAWAFPGVESDLSRSLYHARKFLYIKIGIVSFVVAVVTGLAGIFLNGATQNKPRQNFIYLFPRRACYKN